MVAKGGVGLQVRWCRYSNQKKGQKVASPQEAWPSSRRKQTPNCLTSTILHTAHTWSLGQRNISSHLWGGSYSQH